MTDNGKRNIKLSVAIAASSYAQQEIAYLAGIWPANLSRIKHGHITATPEQKQAIAKVLGLQVSDLWDNVQVAS